LAEHTLPLNSAVDKIFASAWITHDCLLVGSKSNKERPAETRAHAHTPTNHHPTPHPPSLLIPAHMHPERASASPQRGERYSVPMARV
jgi:hypothetical protein